MWIVFVKTPLGFFVGTLIGLFLLLGGIYLALKIRIFIQRKKEDEEIAFFKEAILGLPDIQFFTESTINVLGKNYLIQDKKGSFYPALIFYPYWIKSHRMDRLIQYVSHVEKQKISHLSHAHLYVNSKAFIYLQKQDQIKDLNNLSTLKDLVENQMLTKSEIELIFLNIAVALESLHKCLLDDSIQLYHGLLTPSSIRLVRFSNYEKNYPILMNHGLVYGMTGSLFFTHIVKGKKKENGNPVKNISSWMTELHFLAPETVDSFNESIAYQGDFYAFAKLVLYAFSGKYSECVTSKEIEEAVPFSWKSFISQCLEELPQKRPMSFTPFIDMLTQAQQKKSSQKIEKILQERWLQAACSEEAKRQDLISKLQRLKAFSTSSDKKSFSVHSMIELGYDALKEKDWDKAISIFHSSLEKEPKSAPSFIGLAIAYYRKKEYATAQVFYDKAKKLDSQSSDIFREYIVFHL